MSHFLGAEGLAEDMLVIGPLELKHHPNSRHPSPPVVFKARGSDIESETSGQKPLFTVKRVQTRVIQGAPVVDLLPVKREGLSQSPKKTPTLSP